MKPITCLLLLSLLAIQCGYRPAGRGRNLPAAAKTVAIAKFKNDTANLLAERFVSAAITEAFIRRSGLRLSQAINQADLLLEGGISLFETAPIAYSARGAVTSYSLRITVHIRLIDMKKNELFYEGNGLVFRDTYETDAGDFFSQEPDVLDKIAAKFASSIVTTILDDF
ncbi:MAG: LptE family protein [Candidatus Aminicenantes bacterium]|nr:LptE family protein [Candidatus Aminicenantes bacterium]